MAYHFGVGNMWATRTDISNPTPAMFGTLQDVQVDFDFTNKELMGQYQVPVAVGRGQMKITAKAKFAAIKASAYQAFFGQTSTTGLLSVALNEAQTVPGTPYQATVTNSATFQSDLGVLYASSGLALTRVATSPAVGQYSVANGVYTFAAADTTLAMLISYSYTSASGGTKITLTNQLMGSGPQFQCNLAQTFTQNNATKVLSLQLNACMSTKLSLPLKNEDWTINEFDFTAFADASNNIGSLSVTDA